jgi:membrane protein required for colicin V production
VNQVDALVLVLLVPFALRGWWRGFLRESLAVIGLLGGVLAAAAGAPRLAAALVARQLLPPLAARAAALIGLFIVVYVGAQVAGLIADRLAKAAFLGGFNRVAGMAFGLVKGAALLGFVLMALEHFLPSPSFAQLIGASKLGHPLTAFAENLLDAGRGLAGPQLGGEHA